MLQTRNLLLNLFIVLPAPGQAPPVTVFNDSEAVWLLVNAYPQIVPRSPATSVRIQTLTRQGQTESPPQIHIDRLEVPIPARSELIKADSWEPVLEERRRARTWIDRLLGLW